jgi:cell wall-associated NlpC family hydrolase
MTPPALPAAAAVFLGLAIAVLAGGCSSPSAATRERSVSPSRRETDRAFSPEEIRRRLQAERRGDRTYRNSVPRGINRDRVLLEVVSYLGVPYVYGAKGRRGTDCSGFTAAVYGAALGMRLPRSAREQFAAGVPVNPDSLCFGDLVFFDTRGDEDATHVGIYLEDDVFAHAGVTSGVTLSSIEGPYYRTRFLGARRVVR